MNEAEFRQKTKRFALDVIRLVESLPNGKSVRVISDQLVRSGTSVGANYRAACRGKSKADMISKLGTVLEEADESMYWMELLLESGFVSQDGVSDLMEDADQIVSMTVSSIKTLKDQT